MSWCAEGLVWSDTQHTFHFVSLSSLCLSLCCAPDVGEDLGKAAGSVQPSLSQHRERSLASSSKDCPYCGKSFRTSHHLKVHLRIHTGQYIGRYQPPPLAECGRAGGRGSGGWEAAFLQQWNIYCTPCKIYLTSCTDIPSGVRLIYRCMNIGLIWFWNQSVSDMMDTMQTNWLHIHF